MTRDLIDMWEAIEGHVKILLVSTAVVWTAIGLGGLYVLRRSHKRGIKDIFRENDGADAEGQKRP